MMRTFMENHSVYVGGGEYDVIVIGGGIAGVSAALAARRSGSKVLLIEKSTMLGGLATVGFIAYYLPLCDGKGRKIIGGIAEELLHLSIEYGHNNLPDEWKNVWKDNVASINTSKRYRTAFSPASFVLALDELFENQGIDVMYDTLFCRVKMDQDVCQGIFVENKTGTIFYSAKVFIDTTGDAQVMTQAGISCECEKNWLTYWAYSTSFSDMQEAIDSHRIEKGIRLETLGADRDGNRAPSESDLYFGDTNDENNRFIKDSRDLMREKLKQSNRSDYMVVALPNMPQYRKIRRIESAYNLSEADVFKHFDDSIGCTGDFRFAGPIYEIPYRSLINANVKNIITAGRCIGASGDAWEVTRVIPPAALTGQAAGAAAAMIKNKSEPDFSEVPLKLLQEQLTEGGVMIHF